MLDFYERASKFSARMGYLQLELLPVTIVKKWLMLIPVILFLQDDFILLLILKYVWDSYLTFVVLTM